MKVAYGIDVEESDDPYIMVAQEAIKGIKEAGTPGTFWVDLFPMLKYVPSWFPGGGFQRKAAYWREINKSMTEDPFRYVKELQKNGSAVPSMAASLIDHLPNEDDPQRPSEERLAQDVAAVSFIGG